MEDRALLSGFTDGLIAYYPFNGNANDESGNGNEGTANGPTLTTDRFGSPNSAYSFDGIDDFIAVPDSPDFDLTNAVTFSTWVNHDLSQSGYAFVKGQWLVPEIFSIGFNEGKPLVNVNTSDGSYHRLQSDESIPVATWTHIVGVYDGTDTGLSIYVNGVQKGNMDVSGPLFDNSTPLYIGQDFPRNGIDAGIDDIAIYNRALSQDEVVRLFSHDPTAPLSFCSDFSVDPGLETNNPDNFFISDGVFEVNNYTNSQEYGTYPVDYEGGSFAFSFDIKILERDTGDTNIGLFSSSRKSNQNLGPRESTIYVLYGGYGQGVSLRGHDANGDPFRIPTGDPDIFGHFDLNTVYHTEVTYDATTRIARLVVTSPDDPTFLIDNSVSIPAGLPALPHLGVSSVGSWITDGRYQKAQIDNLCFEQNNHPAIVVIDLSEKLTYFNGTRLTVFSVVDGRVIVTVTQQFGEGGWIADWGEVTREGDTFIVDPHYEHPGWAYTLAITYLSHSYDLGPLVPGNYIFEVNYTAEGIGARRVGIGESVPFAVESENPIFATNPPRKTGITGPDLHAGDLTPTVTWDSLPGTAVDYWELIGYHMLSGKQVVNAYVGGDETAFTMPPASLGTHEFWLRGYNAAGAEPWESGDRYYFHVVPPAVNLLTVQITGPISTVPDDTPFVTWADFPDAATYDARVYSLSLGVEVARFDSFDGTTFELRELPMGDSYSVHLRANTNSGGTTVWSAPFLFQVDEATDDSPIDLSNSLDDLFSGVGSGLIDELLIGN